MKLPYRFEACFPDVHLEPDGTLVNRGGPDLHLRFEVRDGVPQVREVFLQSNPEGREIRAADVKWAADLENFITIACQMAAPHISALPVLGEHGFEYPDVTAGPAEVQTGVARARRNTRRQIPEGRLTEIAEVYRDNPGRGTKAVAERFGLKPRTASLYVKRARDAGLLEEASKP